MQTKMIFISLLATSIMIGCGSNNKKTSTENNTTLDTNKTHENNTSTEHNISKTRFELLTINQALVANDNISKLQWANGPKGCQAYTSKTDAQRATMVIKNFCADSTFAGYSDWRVPLATEQSTFIKEMNASGFTPYYTNPACTRVMGLDASKTILKTINTRNASPIAEIKDWAEQVAGMRCVRQQ
jgi:hypothetical protein